MNSGPLAGIVVVEIAGIGPGPFAASLLAGMGAEVIRIERPGGGALGFASSISAGGRARVLALDLKNAEGRGELLRIVESADVLMEGFRPGVMERLGLGPGECLRANPRLVYARLTGWGQSGPLASTAGHDINYIALTGALGSFARTGQAPTPPLNLLGDLAGGSLYLIFGVLAALVERQRSNQGQVVDAAMIDGVSSLMSPVYELRAMGAWPGEPGSNLLDTGAPFYEVYRTADDRFIAVGCLEPQFYAAFLDGLGLSDADLPAQYDQDGWPELRERFASIIAGRTRDEWTEVFAGTDTCVTPVLSLDEAPSHPHNLARETFVRDTGAWAPAIAPRLSRTPGSRPASPNGSRPASPSGPAT
jgi:alpha-methylacyl-CoA racemase